MKEDAASCPLIAATESPFLHGSAEVCSGLEIRHWAPTDLGYLFS